MKKSIISAKIFPRRVAESAEKGQEKGLNFRILSAPSAPLREYFSWCGFGCGFAALGNPWFNFFGCGCPRRAYCAILTHQERSFFHLFLP
jgi:hypothetical protein